MYLNCLFDDGERLALEIATVRGWSDFCRWAQTLDADTFPRVRRLALDGKAEGEKALEQELRKAVKAKSPGKSAGSVASRLIEVVPWQGTMSVSDEPDDSEMD